MIIRKRALDTIYQLAKKNPNVIYVGSDLGIGTLKEMQNELPGQFLMESISEGYIIGLAGGLAMSGKTPFVNTIATFLTRRCFDQIAVDVCLGNYNVRLVSNGGGLVYAPLGPTHVAIEDISLMRSLPNMTVIVPADADEMERAILASQDYQGPIYFRCARGGDPLVDQGKHSFKIGKAHILAKPEKFLIIATGIMVHKALQVAEKLQEQSIQTGVVNVHTVKPLDKDTLVPLLKQTPVVMTLEEHSLIGGLGSAVSELVAQGARHSEGKFKMLGIQDCFPDKYGRQENLLGHFGLDVPTITTKAIQLINEPVTAY